MRTIFYCLFFAALVYEMVAIAFRPDATISAIVEGISASWPIVPFLLGLLMGHWFGSQRK